MFVLLLEVLALLAPQQLLEVSHRGLQDLQSQGLALIRARDRGLVVVVLPSGLVFDFAKFSFHVANEPILLLQEEEHLEGARNQW